MLHALITPNNTIDRIESHIDPNVQTKAGFYWVPVIDIPRPAYNSETQIARQNIIINEDNVTRDWTIRDKTPEEIDGDKLQKINNIDPVIFKILYNIENNIRAIKNESSLTVDQYKIMLKDLM